MVCPGVRFGRSRQTAIVVLLLFATLLSTACGAVFVSGGTGCFAPTAVPVLLSVSPTTINQNGLPATIIVTGVNFQPSSIVRGNGQVLTTVFIDSNHLNAVINVQTLAFVNPDGSVFISVGTTGQGKTVFGCPNGGFSGTFTIFVN